MNNAETQSTLATRLRDTVNIGHKAQRKTLKIKNTTQETKK
jgi:hypothetical protein